jgi:hypothetical protein
MAVDMEALVEAVLDVVAALGEATSLLLEEGTAPTTARLTRGVTTATTLPLIDQCVKSASRLATVLKGAGIGMMRIMFLTPDMLLQPLLTPTPWT